MRTILMMLFLVLGATALVGAQTAKPSKSKPQYECKPSADEQCPSPADYASLRIYIDKYRAPQDEQDRINGLVMRLQQATPEGFHWDGNKLMYVRNPKPAAKDYPLAPSSPPAPAKK
jgi:hypothetical protein